MKKFNFTLCVFLLLSLFVSCERPDYSDEIYDTYREAERLSTSGAIIDGNMWSARSENEMSFTKAEDYCHYLTELGYNDWRLPTIDELRTLIKECQQTKKGGSCGFTDECLLKLIDIDNDYDYYFTCDEESNCRCDRRYSYYDESSYSKLGDWTNIWSSIPTKYHGDEAWYVDFGNGGIYSSENYYYSETCHVRCVR